MSIGIGSSIPSSELLRWDGTGIVRAASDALVADGKTLVIGVVGAFTPICTDSHLKDYLPIIPSLKETGVVQRFICTGVVDPFVFHAWGEALGADGLIEFWSDPYGAFAEAIGITADFTAIGLGRRSGRYSMIVNAGTVETLNVEEDPSIVSVSGAALMKEQLGLSGATARAH